MKPWLLLLLVCGMNAHALDIEWVTVGDAGHAPDKTGYGAVGYEFQMAKFEVTIGQYAEFLNAVAANDPRGLWNASMGSALLTDNNQGGIRNDLPVFINRNGAPGAYRYEVIAGQERRPVVYVSFLDAMRFVNWLHNGQGKGDTETGAYDIAKHGGLARHESGAKVWIATENEWYKAAYFQPQAKGGPAGNYWLYPTRSNEVPQFRAEGASEPNSANYSQKNVANLPAGAYTRMYPVGSYPGSASYYGTFDQGGNAWEWNEALVFDMQRGMRGGCVAHTFEKMKSLVRTSSKPEKKYPDTGFRLARAVPKNGDATSVQPTPKKQP
jgi:formylglycine-generating enzyme required for sulfatase activity